MFVTFGCVWKHTSDVHLPGTSECMICNYTWTFLSMILKMHTHEQRPSHSISNMSDQMSVQLNSTEWVIAFCCFSAINCKNIIHIRNSLTLSLLSFRIASFTLVATPTNWTTTATKWKKNNVIKNSILIDWKQKPINYNFVPVHGMCNRHFRFQSRLQPFQFCQLYATTLQRDVVSYILLNRRRMSETSATNAK